jgi:tetratricopeptide (TPR) repeat protein
MAEQAIPYWTQASRASLDTFANQEATEQARRGIKLLKSVPESPQRVSQELALQSMLGMALLSTYGYVDPRVQEVFTRAQELCEDIGDAPQLFQVVVGLWMYYIIASELDEAFEQAQRLLRIAETTDNPAHHLQARYCQAFVLFYQADFLAAKTHLETAMKNEVDDCDYAAQSASGDDTRLHVRVLLALVNWHLGFVKTSARLVKEANSIAGRAGHPWGKTFAAFYSAWFHQMRGDARKTLSYANEAAAIAEDKGFRFWLPLVGFMRAWAANREPSRVSKPLNADGAEKMKTALGLYRGVGAGAGVTYLSLELADDFIALGMLDEAEAELDGGSAAMTRTGEDFFESEYSRLRGKVCLASYESSQDKDQLDQADKLFRRALTTAQRIESKGLELRAAINRAGMLSLKGRHDEGIRLLEGILLRFDEVDDSEDFENARKLIKKMKKKSKQAE